jgi:hypothetical protein
MGTATMKTRLKKPFYLQTANPISHLCRSSFGPHLYRYTEELTIYSLWTLCLLPPHCGTSMARRSTRLDGHLGHRGQTSLFER